MPGQAIVTIRDKSWQAYLATTYAELTTGLRGLPAILPGTGMLFVLPQDRTVTVTTQGVNFPIDIIFISSQLEVVSVALGVSPNVLLTESTPVRYFLEVNAGEAEGIESGDAVNMGVPQVTEATDWISPVVSFAGVVMVGAMLVNMGKTMSDAIFGKPRERPVLYGPRGEHFLPQTGKPMVGKYEIDTDRMGNIIITRTDNPGKDVFLQLESDKALVYDLLKKGERKDLDAGWEVQIKRSEPRASILDELWESLAQPQKLPQTTPVNEDIGLPLPFAGAGKDRLMWRTTLGGRTIAVQVTGIAGLSPRQVEDAFAASTARVSNIVIGRELPFAAATREKLWWLATIRDKTVQVEVSGIRGLSERQLEDAFSNSVAIINVTGAGAVVKLPTTKKPTRDDVTVEAWQERDRLGIWITDKRTDKTVAEWWDEDAREMFEQGFFKPGVPQRAAEKPGSEFVNSVLDYAESAGILAGSKYLAPALRDAYYWTAVNKDTGEIVESHVPYTSSGRALRGGKAYASRHWRGDTALIEVGRQPHRYSENLKIAPIVSETVIVEKTPAIVPTKPRPVRPKGDELEFLPDSPEFLAYTIEDIGYRDKIDSAFLQAIARAKGERQ